MRPCFFLSASLYSVTRASPTPHPLRLGPEAEESDSEKGYFLPSFLALPSTDRTLRRSRAESAWNGPKNRSFGTELKAGTLAASLLKTLLFYGKASNN